MKLVFGVCTSSWEKLCTNVLPAVKGRPLIALSGQSSIAEAYNYIVDIANSLDADALVLQHDDLEITDPNWEEKLAAELEPDTGIIGIAGGRHANGIAWWNYSPIGHQRTNVSNIDFGVHRGQTDLLEGSLLILSKEAVVALCFDEKYPGFHGYDADISTQARNTGLKVKVADIDTWHHTEMGYKSESSHSDWLKADELFRGKWG